MAIAEKKSASVEQVLTGWKEQGVRNVRFEMLSTDRQANLEVSPLKGFLPRNSAG